MILEHDTLPIHLGFKQYDITQLEMINIVVAAKIWASHWSNKKIRIYSDNMAVIQVLTTGRARDQTLATCARNIWLIAALNNIQFQFSHIPGKNNNLADLLSRWHTIHKDVARLLTVPGVGWTAPLSGRYSISLVFYGVFMSKWPLQS